MADDRLIPNRQTAITRLVNKYGTGSSALDLSSFSPSTVAGIRTLDTQRANMGRNPFTSIETLLGAQATDTGRPVAQEPNQPWYADAARNVQQIVSEVPKLPITLAREVGQLGDLPNQIPGALESASSPVEQLGNLAQLPGLRMIPGAFVASQFGTGGQGVSGLADNPVFTALDVLPYASKGARLTNTVKTAERLAEEARPVLAETGVPTRTPPITTLLKYGRRGGPIETTAKLGNIEYPALEANAVGRAMDNIAGKIAETRPGQWGAKAFGREARGVTRDFHRYNAYTIEGKFPKGAPVNTELAAKASQLVDDADTLARDFSDIPAETQAQIARSIEVGRPGTAQQLEALHPQATEYAARYKALNDEWGRSLAMADEGLREVDIAGGREIYDTSTANRIQKARDLNAQQQAVAHLRATLDPATDYRAAPTDILTDARTAMADTAITGKVKAKLAQAYTQALENAGVDVSALRKLGGKPTAASLRTLFDDVTIPDNLTPVSRGRLGEVAAQLRSMARTDPTVADLVRSLQREDYARARDMAATLEQRTKFRVDVDLPSLRNELRAFQRSQQKIAGLESAGFTPAKVSQAQRVLADVEARATPARFQPAVLDALDARVRAYLTDNYSGERLDALLDQAAYRLYDDPEFAAAVPEMKAFKAEARRSWQELRNEGYDPTFVHHVTPQRARSLMFPRVLDYTPSLSQVKARLWDSSAPVSNLAMTLNARGMEYLIQQGSKALVDDFVTKWTKPLDELRREFHPAAADALAADPTLEYRTHIQSLIEKDWAPFDPDSFINPRTARPGANPETTLYAPRVVVDTLERLRPNPSELGKLTDPVMKVFRTSLLPLSPRWHVYNIIGGAVMLMGRAENPLTIWRYVRDARALMREGGVGGLADRSVGSGVRGTVEAGNEAQLAAARLAPPVAGRGAGEFLRDVDLATDTSKYAALHDYMAGKTLRRLWDSASTKRVLRDPFNKLVEKSYSFNEWFDDFYKSMAYMEGFDRSLTKGLTREQSIVRGIEASRQILQNWDTLTPMERSAMRFLMPFYGWTRTLLKYTFTYPTDHPWRTSIVASLARAELEDQNQALPQRLRDLLFIGSPDAEGNQTAINLSGMNPFRDISSYFTLGGFIAGGEGDIGVLTSQLNPAISTVLQWAGVDPSSGSPELYPDMRYDATTGQLVAAPRENPGLGALGNFLPQSRIFTQLTGMSRQFSEMANRDPAAAGRMLASSAGIPVLSREINIPGEVTKAESVRLQELKDQLNAALKSGDRGTFVAMYPNLGGLFDARAQQLRDEGGATPSRQIKGGDIPGALEVIVNALKTVAPGL